MDLSVKTRDIVGKKVRVLRREGLVPAELYGHGTKNVHLSVPAKEFAKVFKEAGESTVVNLVVEGSARTASGAAASTGAGASTKPAAKVSAIIHGVIHNYLSGEVEHIDFYQVRMDEKIKANIPLEFTGVSVAVKEKAAIINKSMNEIEVEALPQDLPHHIVVDLALLDDLNKSIYVRDLAVPKNVKVLIEDDTAVATATPPLAAEEVVAAPTDVADVKVETEEKKSERQAEKAEKSEKE